MGFQHFLPRRLRTRFTVLALASTAAIFLVIVPAVIGMERQLVFDQQVDQIESYLDAAVNRGDSDLRATRQHAMALADTIQQWTPMDREAWFRMMEHALTRLPKAYGIRVAFEPGDEMGPSGARGLYVRRGTSGIFLRSEIAYPPEDSAAPGGQWYLPLRGRQVGESLDGVWSKPFDAPETEGERVMTCSVPIFRGDATSVLAGVAAIDVTLEVFRDAMRQLDLYKDAVIYLIGPDKDVRLAVKPRTLDDKEAEARFAAEVARRPDAFRSFPQIQKPADPVGWFVAIDPYRGERTLFLYEHLPRDSTQLVYAIPRRELETEWLSLSAGIAAFGLLSMIGMGLLLRWSAGQATRNLDVLRLGVRNVQAGNLRIKLPPAVAHDETADVIDAFNGMVAELDRTIHRSEQLARDSERAATELDLARHIQQSALPGPIYFPGGEIVSLALPAQEVGGDFYEHFALPGGRVALAVGDVSGKGVSAALFAMRAAQLLRSVASNLTLAEALTQVNTLLARSNPELMFITLFFAVWDPARESLRWVNAGHNPPLLLRADGQVERLALRGGPALGPMRGKSYSESESQFSVGDLLAIYTDGITEAPAPDGRQFGEGRLCTLLAERRHEPLARTTECLVAEVCAWQGSCDRFDDITLLLAQGQGLVRQLELAAVPAHIAPVVDAVRACASEGGMDAPSIGQITLAADEAVTNIILYALGADPAKRFRVYLAWSADALILRFEDEGPVFNPDALPPVDLTAPLDRRPIGRLGWVLIRHACDDARMERVADTNILTLVRRRRAMETPPAET